MEKTKVCDQLCDHWKLWGNLFMWYCLLCHAYKMVLTLWDLQNYWCNGHWLYLSTRCYKPPGRDKLLIHSMHLLVREACFPFKLHVTCFHVIIVLITFDWMRSGGHTWHDARVMILLVLCPHCSLCFLAHFTMWNSNSACLHGETCKNNNFKEFGTELVTTWQISTKHSSTKLSISTPFGVLPNFLKFWPRELRVKLTSWLVSETNQELGKTTNFAVLFYLVTALNQYSKIASMAMYCTKFLHLL